MYGKSWRFLWKLLPGSNYYVFKCFFLTLNLKLYLSKFSKIVSKALWLCCFRVLALYNSVRGSYSEVGSFTTHCSAPDVPLPPKLSHRTKTSLSLQWKVRLHVIISECTDSVEMKWTNLNVFAVCPVFIVSLEAASLLALLLTGLLAYVDGHVVLDFMHQKDGG